MSECREAFPSCVWLAPSIYNVVGSPEGVSLVIYLCLVLGAPHCWVLVKPATKPETSFVRRFGTRDGVDRILKMQDDWLGLYEYELGLTRPLDKNGIW